MDKHRRKILGGLTGTSLLRLVPTTLGVAYNSGSAASDDVSKNLAEQLADYAFELQSIGIDREAIESAKFRVIDSIGCSLSALDEPPVQMCRKIASRSAAGTSSLWGTSLRSQPELAAFSNGVAMRYHDLNDVYVGKTTGHPSDNIAACFAVAESVNASGRALLDAIVLAYEIDCRLMDAVDLTARGWDHPIFTLPATALASAKLLGLDAKRMTQAINLSLASTMAMYQTRVQQMSDWKGVADPDALRNGVFASLLAAEGMTGPAPIFEGKAGLFAQVSGMFKINVQGFGGSHADFKIVDCGYKLYPAQVYTLTSIPAAIALAKKIGDLEKIESLQIATTKTGLLKSATGKEKWAPETKETADHSLPYVTARAMFDGDIHINSYTKEKIHDKQLLTFMSKITVVEDPVLSAREPATTPCRLTAKLKTGETIIEQVDDVAGFPTRPMTRKAIEEKFRSNVAKVLTTAQASATLSRLWNLENETDLRELSLTFKANHFN